jgi:hypothetical protein
MIQEKLICEHPDAPPRSIGVRVAAAQPASRPLCGRWHSPGSLITAACAKFKEVAVVAEKYEGNRHSVLVLLREDPDEVLDAIYDAEAKVIHDLKNMPFDLRVTVPLQAWDLDQLRRTYLVHYAAR